MDEVINAENQLSAVVYCNPLDNHKMITIYDRETGTSQLLDLTMMFSDNHEVLDRIQTGQDFLNTFGFFRAEGDRLGIMLRYNTGEPVRKKKVKPTKKASGNYAGFLTGG